MSRSKEGGQPTPAALNAGDVGLQVAVVDGQRAQHRPRRHPRQPAVGDEPGAGRRPRTTGTSSASRSAAAGRGRRTSPPPCMFQLQRLGLLQRVDYISAVSGGSLRPRTTACSDDASGTREPSSRNSPTRSPTTSFRTLMPWNSLALTFTDCGPQRPARRRFPRHSVLASGKRR